MACGCGYLYAVLDVPTLEFHQLQHIALPSSSFQTRRGAAPVSILGKARRAQLHNSGCICCYHGGVGAPLQARPAVQSGALPVSTTSAHQESNYPNVVPLRSQLGLLENGSNLRVRGAITLSLFGKYSTAIITHESSFPRRNGGFVPERTLCCAIYLRLYYQFNLWSSIPSVLLRAIADQVEAGASVLRFQESRPRNALLRYCRRQRRERIFTRFAFTL
ncbi:hypothetical protein JG687_00002060 [Phytophthora cactorum]|uniref:Uncharacterized protein n=2 Tax=Phytophthora TaxID=4783 RepID=A0A8J5IGI2_9STRA|nr:hypothetical protein JG688_00016162 [Phytophthora aleatoria]KAG6971394.1 hypothetical protein JG687_00002060 [Phytophthora cactorum]